MYCLESGNWRLLTVYKECHLWSSPLKTNLIGSTPRWYHNLCLMTLQLKKSVASGTIIHLDSSDFCLMSTWCVWSSLLHLEMHIAYGGMSKIELIFFLVQIHLCVCMWCFHTLKHYNFRWGRRLCQGIAFEMQPALFPPENHLEAGRLDASGPLCTVWKKLICLFIQQWR